MMTIEEMHKRFAYHKPQSYTVTKKHDDIRNACWNLASMLDCVVPAGRELATALTKLEEAMFWANAGVARNQEAPDA